MKSDKNLILSLIACCIFCIGCSQKNGNSDANQPDQASAAETISDEKLERDSLAVARQLAIALHCYHDSKKVFPPAYSVDAKGNLLHSWRTLVLPYLASDSATQVANQIDLDQPWNSPANKKVFENNNLSEFFASPRCRNGFNGRTNFVAVVGDKTAIRNRKSMKLENIANGPGTSSTLVFLEVPNSSIHWSEPRDLTVDEALKVIKESKAQPGLIVVYCDSSAKFLTNSISAAELEKMFDATSRR